MWNARALHKLCFPQRGWEQNAHIYRGGDTHIETHTEIREMEEDKKERRDRDRKEREEDRELMNLSTLIK